MDIGFTKAFYLEGRHLKVIEDARRKFYQASDSATLRMIIDQWAKEHENGKEEEPAQ